MSHYRLNQVNYLTVFIKNGDEIKTSGVNHSVEPGQTESLCYKPFFHFISLLLHSSN